jgi:hypothetical protein
VSHLTVFCSPGIQKTMTTSTVNTLSSFSAQLGHAQDHSSGKLGVLTEVEDEDLQGSSSATSSPQGTSNDIIASEATTDVVTGTYCMGLTVDPGEIHPFSIFTRATPLHAETLVGASSLFPYKFRS